MALTETNGIVEEATEEEMMDAAARADLTGMGRPPFRVCWTDVYNIGTTLSCPQGIAEESCMSGQHMATGMKLLVEGMMYCYVCWGLLQATVDFSSSAVLVCCDCMLKCLAGNLMHINVS